MQFESITGSPKQHFTMVYEKITPFLFILIIHVFIVLAYLVCVSLCVYFHSFIMTYSKQLNYSLSDVTWNLQQNVFWTFICTFIANYLFVSLYMWHKILKENCTWQRVRLSLLSTLSFKKCLMSLETSASCSISCATAVYTPNPPPKKCV